MKRSRSTTQRVRRSMKDTSVKQPKKIPQEVQGRIPGGWAPIQESIAESAGISLLLVEGYQPPALAIANNNSICEALQSSPDHVGLCDPFCGAAHSRAVSAGTITHYRCHAGLQCFAMPVEIDSRRQLAVIGGRAFVKSADYRELAERFRAGDLKDLASDDLFRNVIFADDADLDHAALRVARAAKEFKEQPTSEEVSLSAVEAAEAVPVTEDQPSRAEDRRTEGGQRPVLDRKSVV